MYSPVREFIPAQENRDAGLLFILVIKFSAEEVVLIVPIIHVDKDMTALCIFRFGDRKVQVPAGCQRCREYRLRKSNRIQCTVCRHRQCDGFRVSVIILVHRTGIPVIVEEKIVIFIPLIADFTILIGFAQKFTVVIQNRIPGPCHQVISSCSAIPLTILDIVSSPTVRSPALIRPVIIHLYPFCTGSVS